jgi:hypothetical protein
MRLSVSVNDQPVVTGSLTTTGWLSAHVNLSQDASDAQSNQVSIVAIDTSEEPNTIHSHWEAGPIAIGDRIEIEILPDGESHPPTGVRRTSDSPNNLFSNLDQARALLAAVKSCDDILGTALESAYNNEPVEEIKKIQLAIGSVLIEFDRQLISPVLRRHPELLGEAEQMGIR